MECLYDIEVRAGRREGDMAPDKGTIPIPPSGQVHSLGFSTCLLNTQYSIVIVLLSLQLCAPADSERLLRKHDTPR
jgi:hypothetical protein